jgi:hypothetical protein
MQFLVLQSHCLYLTKRKQDDLATWPQTMLKASIYMQRDIVIAHNMPLEPKTRYDVSNRSCTCSNNMHRDSGMRK